MAIDINTLHIGSHVLYNGKRERVRGLDEDNGLIIRFPAEYVLASDVEPIPIPPELLTELGFEIAEEFGAFTVWKKDKLIVKIIGERKVVAFIDKMHSLEIRYLHELEAFLYLTTKTELIKE